MTKNDHADVDRNMEPLTRKNKERSRHGGGDGPQGNWIYIYIYIYINTYTIMPFLAVEADTNQHESV